MRSSHQEILNCFTDAEIFWAVYRNDYLNPILAGEIRKIIPQMDREDQVLFSDLNNNDILLTAYNDLFGSSEAVSLLLDNDYLREVVVAVVDDFGGYFND
jgi:hypothetical protein